MDLNYDDFVHEFNYGNSSPSLATLIRYPECVDFQQKVHYSLQRTSPHVLMELLMSGFSDNRFPAARILMMQQIVMFEGPLTYEQIAQIPNLTVEMLSLNTVQGLELTADQAKFLILKYIRSSNTQLVIYLFNQYTPRISNQEIFDHLILGPDDDLRVLNWYLEDLFDISLNDYIQACQIKGVSNIVKLLQFYTAD